MDKKFETPVLMNVFGSYEATELIFERHPDDVAKQIEELLHMKPPSDFMGKLSMLGDLFALKNVFPKRLSKKGACQERVQKI